MNYLRQVSASITKEAYEVIKKKALKEDRSISATTKIIIEQALKKETKKLQEAKKWRTRTKNCVKHYLGKK